MAYSRREFIKLMTAAGVSLGSASWLTGRLEALAAEDALPGTPGPGIESWVPTTCGFCSANCGLSVRRIDGIPVGVRGNPGHLVNAGKLCSAGHATIQMLYSPDRVKQPMLRAGRRTHPDWKEISWQDAEAMVNKRLSDLIHRGTPERVAFLDSRPAGVSSEVARAFIKGIGSENFIPIENAQEDRIAAEMFGWDRAPGADIENALVVTLFAFDGFEADGSPVWLSRIYANRRGRTRNRPIYINIGPRFLGSGAKCDHWLPARPGTEGLVAFAMAHQILSSGGARQKYLEERTDWYTEPSRALRQLVSEMTPAVVSDLSGVPSGQIRKAAQIFVRRGPAIALTGNGLPGNPNATMTHIGVSVLNLVAGSVGVPGGLVERSKPPTSAVWESTRASHETGARKSSVTSLADLQRALLHQDPVSIDLLFVRDAHPAIDAVPASALKRALYSTKGLIVSFASEIHETELLADLILPEPTFAERWDLLTDARLVPRVHASLQQPVVEPMFESVQSDEVLIRLAASLGKNFGGRFKASTPEKLVRLAAGGLFSDPKGGPCDIRRTGDGTTHPNSSRKAWSELKTTALWASVKQTTRTIPKHKTVTLPRSLLTLASTGNTVKQLREAAMPAGLGALHAYPFELMIFRLAELREGQTANYPMMMELCGHWGDTAWETWAEIHPHTAAQAGVTHGQRIRVISEIGEIEALARVMETIRPGVVAIPLGLGHEVSSTAGGVGANPTQIIEANRRGDISLSVGVVTRVKIKAA